MNDIMISENHRRPPAAEAAAAYSVDDPAISMTFGINDSPLAGTERQGP